MVVSFEELKSLKDRLREINSLDLKDITWTRDGKSIEVSESYIEEWRFIGLSNCAFFDFVLEDIE